LETGLRQIAEAEGGLAYEIKPSDEPLFSDDPTPPKAPPQRSIIARIRTPNAPGTGALLVSPDRKVLLVVVDLTPEYNSHLNWHVIEKIEDLVHQLRAEGKVPPGLDILLTGSAVLGRDYSLAELRSVRATGLLTVILVAALLIFIYRAPLLALIPLATVYFAVQVAVNLLGLLAAAGYITIFEGLQIYITILAYGAGVDYCLFLTARYKEELDRGVAPAEAVGRAIGGVGSALAASAATVMCGIAMMMFAQFGKFREAGFAIPLSILLVLCATLTFSPSLLCLAGRWAFWPQWRKRPVRNDPGPQPQETPRGGWLEQAWVRVGELLLRRPGVVWLVTVAVMAPFAITAGFLYNQLSYDMIGVLPADATSAAGTRVLQEEFPAGIVGPVTVLVVDPKVDFGSDQGREFVARVTDRLANQKQDLGLADVRSLTAPLGITAQASLDFSGINLPKEERAQATQQAAREHYLTDLGGRTKVGTRLELVLEHSPFSRESVNSLDRLEQAVRDALPDDVRKDAEVHFIGTTPSVRDLELVMQRDRLRIEVLVLVSVLVILVILLRGFLVPVYLLLSVLFSYYTTLGVTFAVFYLLDPAGFSGIDWKVAIFLFTILIAVGEDYNIFLMTRVHEEQERHGAVRGITEALDRTGPIITSCGIIMAGTFASLLAGSLTEMRQLGFALAFGVILDTFIVRPILVPSFLILLRTGRLFWRIGTRQAFQPKRVMTHSS
jgi:putative drug exporter of the RND superfamily